MKNLKNNLFIPFIIALIGTILMVTTVFLPYATAIDDHAENIKENPDAVVYEELDMTAQDMMNISMVEYANVYSNLADQLFGDSSYGVFYVVLVALIGGFALLAALFAFLKKPIAVIVFNVLSFGVFSLQNWDYTDRGVIPSSSYDWGTGYYIFYVAVVITLVGAIWLLVNKIRNKKLCKNENVQQQK